MDMDARIRVGFVGTGWMGEQLLNKIPGKTNAEIAAVYDTDLNMAAEVLKRSGVSRDCLVSDYQEIVSNKDIDAVIIASPNTFHAEQALEAMAAGKHVFCEKPNSTSLKDHKKMVRFDHDHQDLVTMTNYTLFFNPMDQKVKSMIEQGLFGEITQMQINYRHAVNIGGSKYWKTRKDYVGDAVGMGITHAVFSICYFFSPAKAESVFASSHSSADSGFEVDPIWNIMITFDSGATGIVLGDIEGGNSYDLYHNIFGTKGGFVFDSQGKGEAAVKYWNEDTDRQWVYPLCKEEKKHGWPESISLPNSGDVITHSTEESISYFLDHIDRKEKPFLSFSNMRIVQDINFAAQLSAELKEPVTLPAG